MPMVIALQRAQGGDVLTHINEWEAAINVLERDYREEISDMSKIGLFLGMAPEDLPDTVIQQSHQLKGHRHVNDKVASIVDERARLKGSNSVDMGFCWTHVRRLE